MLDLDDFRDVNNTLRPPGRRRAAARDRGGARRGPGATPTCVFRYGGDEFAFLLPRTDAAGALAGRRARPRAGASRALGGAGDARSIGVATFPADGDHAAEVLLAADRACFVAKRDGRDGVATAAEGLALAEEFSLQAPTPVDSEIAPAELRRPAGRWTRDERPAPSPSRLDRRPRDHAAPCECLHPATGRRGRAGARP